MNKKFLILPILITFIGLFILTRPEKVHTLDTDAIPIDTADIISKNIPIPIVTEEDTKQKLIHKNSSKFTNIITENDKKTPETIEHEETNLFEVLTIDEAKEIVKPRKRVKPISAIVIDTNAISSLKVKDKLTLPDIEGTDYSITIVDVKKNNDGSISSRGIFIDEGITYSTTITQGKNTNYITLATPNGMYEIETNKDTGYLYKTNDIRKTLQKSKQNDSITYKIPTQSNPN